MILKKLIDLLGLRVRDRNSNSCRSMLGFFKWHIKRIEVIRMDAVNRDFIVQKRAVSYDTLLIHQKTELRLHFMADGAKDKFVYLALSRCDLRVAPCLS